MVKDGAIFRTTSDTETIVQLIAKSKREIFRQTNRYFISNSQVVILVLMTNKKLVGVRDPFGISHLVDRQIKESFIFASETCTRYSWC